MSKELPFNVQVLCHPCVRVKLCQLRSSSTNTRETKQLVSDLTLFVGYEALSKSLSTRQSSTVRPHPIPFPSPTLLDFILTLGTTKDQSPLAYPFSVETIYPTNISIVPILRSGLSMVESILTLLPSPVPVFHLGMYREKSTLQPVEYYNNLPYHNTATGMGGDNNAGPSELGILVDPIIATGATACAAIDTLKDWGVKKIIVLSILASREGLERAAMVWREGTEFWVCGVDEETDEKGMIKPGLGDIGDRLFGTIGK